MARSLQVLALFSRLGDLSLMPSVSNICRFASRGASNARMGQSHVHGDRVSNSTPRYSDEMPDDELGLKDTEEVEDKLQALVDEARKGQKKVKYHILRRQMTTPGAPQRKLTWDAIKQIRYLKQEQPDEWTVDRLAEGYSVTPDVILRVLRSKFVPAPDRKVQQDAKVMAGQGQRVLPAGVGTREAGLKLPGNHTPAILLSGSSEGAVVRVADKTLMLREEGSGLLAQSSAPVTLLPTHFRAGISEEVHVTRSKEEDSTYNTNPTEEEKEDEESWDGRLLTDEELEEFIEMEKPYPVVQVGNDFFDAEGNFLYRI